MYKLYEIVIFPLDYFFIGLVWLYKLFVSPLKPRCCRFYPTCSSYMIDAIKQFHTFKGIFLGTKRLLRCRGKNKGGYDPVPINIKGDKKWIL